MLPHIKIEAPFVILTDEAHSLLPYLMTPIQTCRTNWNEANVVLWTLIMWQKGGRMCIRDNLLQMAHTFKVNRDFNVHRWQNYEMHVCFAQHSDWQRKNAKKPFRCLYYRTRIQLWEKRDTCYSSQEHQKYICTIFWKISFNLSTNRMKSKYIQIII